MNNKETARIAEWIEEVPPYDNNPVRPHGTTDRKNSKKQSLLMRTLISLGSPSVRENSRTSSASSAKRSTKSSSTVQSGKSASKAPPQKDDAGPADADRYSVSSNGTIRSESKNLALPKQQQDGYSPLSPGSDQGTTYSSIASERAPSKHGSVHGSVASERAKHGSVHGSVASERAPSKRGSVQGSVASERALSKHGSVHGSVASTHAPSVYTSVPIVPKLPPPFLGDLSGPTYKENAPAAEGQVSRYGDNGGNGGNGGNGTLVISLPPSHHRGTNTEPGDITCTLTHVHLHIKGKKKSGKGPHR
ncbi:hypothetical protein Q9L58_007056 [Maublancomyces gigas]|uniref:Uncharacterized protein n=1 Tax=Discina gigas TaxID=1032678 RepID=A0ABR3GDU9_9PEZI